MPDPKRRISVAKHPGVYYRELHGGKRRYEITYSDSEGRRRWQVVDGGLAQADAALADVKQRKRKGERIAPSRATISELWQPWLDSQASLRPRTRERYRTAFENQIVPRLGGIRVVELNEDHVATRLIKPMCQGLEVVRDARGRLVERPRTQLVRAKAENEVGRPVTRMVEKKLGPYSGWTIRATLTPLSRLMSHCVRRGLAVANPVAKLERGERPPVGRREMRILERDEIDRLLTATPERYRPLLATAVFTGLRLGELLGLTWADVDFEKGVLRVRKQLAKDGTRVEPKTAQALRAVVLMPALARLLRGHKEKAFAVGRAKPNDFVFASSVGTAMSARNVSRRGLDKAIGDAGLDADGKPKLRFHDLRHCFASMLIANGADVVFVSRQLGHATPAITLAVYSHLFDSVRHAERTSALLEAAFGTILEMSTDEQRGIERFPLVAEIPREAVDLQGLAASGD
jgi:integrase